MRIALKNTLAITALGALVLGLGSSIAYGDSGRSYGGSSGSGGYGRGGDELRAVGLTRDGLRLRQFDTDRPSSTRKSATVKGLHTDTRLVGIDYRVQDGVLYGVGDAGGVYKLEPGNGASILVVRLTVALQGTTFGVDFNPAANALRVIGDGGQNLRQSFVLVNGAFPATALDTTLAYLPGTPAAGLNGAGYTNNDADPNTATTLYDVDITLDQVSIQSPANAGTLAPTGKLGVDFDGDTGFDIYSRVRSGSTVDVLAFAVNEGRLYKITLFTGKAQSRGPIGNGDVADIAIPLGQL